MRQRAVLLVAHGTVQDEAELPGFLLKVRRGRPAPDALIAETRRRYALIGGSPLLQITRAQAEALQARLQVPVVVAMRLWHPFVEEVLPELRNAGVEHVCVLPMAPFSVDVYHQAAIGAASAAGLREAFEFVPVEPWGSEPALVAAHVEAIEAAGPADATIVTAHSLPQAVLRGGDRYAVEVEASAQAVAARLGATLNLAYQSQSGEGDWLGPDLRTVLERVHRAGARRIRLAPIGFLADHVETLYDLDIEAQAWAAELGVEVIRVPALNTSPGLIDAMESVARRALRA
jgi:ferrochelatase